MAILHDVYELEYNNFYLSISLVISLEIYLVMDWAIGCPWLIRDSLSVFPLFELSTLHTVIKSEIMLMITRTYTIFISNINYAKNATKKYFNFLTSALMDISRKSTMEVLIFFPSFPSVLPCSFQEGDFKCIWKRTSKNGRKHLRGIMI